MTSGWKRMAAAASLWACIGSASALQDVVGNVLILEPTYMPDRIAFMLSQGVPLCPAGTWFYWTHPNKENVTAVYQTLLAAKTASSRVRVYVKDGDPTCTPQYVQWIN